MKQGQQVSQIQQLSQAMKDKDGTIETLERQLVQAGIKGKVMQADVEISKKKAEVKANINKQYVETEGKQKLLRNVMANNAEANQRQAAEILMNTKKDLENTSKE